MAVTPAPQVVQPPAALVPGARPAGGDIPVILPLWRIWRAILHGAEPSPLFTAHWG
jgi:hypothetical protein